MGIVITDNMYLLESEFKSQVHGGTPQYCDIHNSMIHKSSDDPLAVMETNHGMAYRSKTLIDATMTMCGKSSVVYQTVWELCKRKSFDYRSATYLTDIHFVSIHHVESILHKVLGQTTAKTSFEVVRCSLPACMINGVCHVSAIGVYNIVKGGPKALIRTENIDMMNDLHTELWNASIDTGCDNVVEVPEPEMDAEDGGVMLACHFDGDCYHYTAEDGREFEADDFINAKLYADAELKELVTHDVTDDKVSIKLTTPFGGIEEYITWADLCVPLYVVWPVKPRTELMCQVENIMWDAITDEGLKRILVVYNEERQDLNGKDNDAQFVVTKNRPYKY